MIKLWVFHSSLPPSPSDEVRMGIGSAAELAYKQALSGTYLKFQHDILRYSLLRATGVPHLSYVLLRLDYNQSATTRD